MPVQVVFVEAGPGAADLEQGAADLVGGAVGVMVDNNHTRAHIDAGAVRQIKYEPGYRARFWQRNCVAIGLSAGFIEPLEASALALVEMGATMVADELPASRAAMDGALPAPPPLEAGESLPIQRPWTALDIGLDGGRGGNSSRWINHSCAPNCEAEEDERKRVFLHALRDIAAGEELFFDYGLVVDGRYTAKLKAEYACHCGSPNCRGTMLAPKLPAKKASRGRAE